jgi:hypothetical protein
MPTDPQSARAGERNQSRVNAPSPAAAASLSIGRAIVEELAQRFQPDRNPHAVSVRSWMCFSVHSGSGERFIVKVKRTFSLLIER